MNPQARQCFAICSLPPEGALASFEMARQEVQ
jgi:hypothetical protein